jgi:hypothetical protein
MSMLQAFPNSLLRLGLRTRINRRPDRRRSGGGAAETRGGQGVREVASGAKTESLLERTADLIEAARQRDADGAWRIG